MDATLTRALDTLGSQIEHSYANNSLLYTHLAERADLTAIVTFLMWDAAQPPFVDYLSRWIDLVPASVRPLLEDHIRVERDEGHSLLFRDMLQHLSGLCRAEPRCVQSVLATLNYTFSEQCTSEEEAGFFLGGFWATELMSAKRCAQLYRGLKRLGVEEGALVYLKIHFEADSDHGNEVRSTMIQTALTASPGSIVPLARGVHDRLARSGNYLRWYESNRLFHRTAEHAQAYAG